MSMKVTRDELDNVSGGADAALGSRNKGGICCIAYECDCCGTWAQVCDYKPDGTCTGCETEHQPGCIHASDNPQVSCTSCKYRMGTTQCTNPGK